MSKLLMCIATLFTIVFSSYNLEAQLSNRVWLDRSFNAIPDEDSASYYQQITADSDKFRVEVFYKSGDLRMDGHYADPELFIKDGYFKYYFMNGQVESEGLYVSGFKQGIWKRFTWEGKEKPERFYPKAKELTKKSKLTAPASFPGGQDAMIQFINEVSVYPEAAIKKKLEGTVKISLEINERGKITTATILNGVHYFLDKEAMEAITQMPVWNPATVDGVPIKSRFVLPIKFEIDPNTNKGTIL